MIEQFLTMLGHPVAVVARKPVRTGIPSMKVLWPVDQSPDMEERLEQIQAIADDYNSVYVNLNPLKPQYLGVRPVAGTSVRNVMIQHRTRLLIDIDGHGTPLEEAERQKDAIKEHLPWPVLIETYSGNGYGLIYDCDLPVSAMPTVRDFLLTLKRKFPCVDASVTNAARLTRLIGTHNVRDNERVETRILNAPDTANTGGTDMFATTR